ncbi:hypothetical protein G6F35_014255 [Rhizopus arrhizus]|nr:hypothetical protein G6F35_014255 [Rhizopus arrhizus]
MSSTVTPLPSMWAAAPSKAPIVTTPVPPTPAITTRYAAPPAMDAGTGNGASGNGDSPAPDRAGLRSTAPSAVTKLGQNPSTQEKSLLHEDWLMRRLVPSGVSSGSTDKQLDLTEQSPQPSHTASLMKARRSGSG